MAVDVPGWRARILGLMRTTGLPDEDGPRVLDALAAEAVMDERNRCCQIIYGQCDSDNVAYRTVKAIRQHEKTE